MILNNDSKYRGELGKSLRLDEYSSVERPFMDQLRQLDWDHVLELTLQQTPEQSFRTSADFISFTNMTAKYKELISRILEHAKANHFKMIQT